MDFDLIVLGGGSGGLASAVRAAKYGANVAVVEKSHLGGTCVNLGCVPKKVMFNAATIAKQLHQAPDYGFAAVDVKLDWTTLITKREAYITKLREIYSKRFTQYNMTHLHGEGHFIDAQTISVAGRHYKASHIIIATGGEPTLPKDIVGINHAITSDGFFHLTQKPHKVAIIGSGYIGVELAGVLHGLGINTHLFIRGNRPLSRFDAMLGDTLLEIMQAQGLEIHLNHHAQAIHLQSNGKKSIHCKNNSEIADFDIIIAAVGRSPRTFSLNLDAIGVLTDEHGLVKVDKYQNTSIPGIYAIGDVTNAPALTPVAIAAGRRLCDRVFGNQADAHLNYDNICSVVFTHPPIGSVGYSEEEALGKFETGQLKIYKTRFTPMFDALSEQKVPTSMKLITLGPTEKIIGLHVIGYGADEMLQGFGVAIKIGACKRDFDNTVAIHPTSAEEFVTLI